MSPRIIWSNEDRSREGKAFDGADGTVFRIIELRRHYFIVEKLTMDTLKNPAWVRVQEVGPQTDVVGWVETLLRYTAVSGRLG